MNVNKIMFRSPGGNLLNAIKKKLFLLIIALSLLPLAKGHFVHAAEPENCAPAIDFEKWDEKSLLEQFRAGTIDPEFRRFFNRDPQRTVPNVKNIIVAPADGKIAEIKRDRNKITIVISIVMWDVHVQRVPLSGEVLTIEHREGKYLSTKDKDHLEKNFQVITTLKTEVGTIRVFQIAGIHANRIETFIDPGAKVNTGDKLGRILLGSTAVLELPPNVKLKIKPGKKVYAGETIMAQY